MPRISEARVTRLSLLASVLGTLGLTLALVLLYVWLHERIEAGRPATCLATHCFCERPRFGSLLRQPVDSITSLAYIFSGLLSTGIAARMKRMTQYTVTETVLIASMGMLFIFVGAASFIYHASLSFIGQFFDIFSMYLFGTLLLIGAFVRRRQLRWASALSIYLALNVILAFAQYNYPDLRRYIFAVILLPGIVLEFLPSTSGENFTSTALRPIKVGFGILAVAYIFWILDNDRVACWPTSIWQGHGAWHVLTAIAGFFVALHYWNTRHRSCAALR